MGTAQYWIAFLLHDYNTDSRMIIRKCALGLPRYALEPISAFYGQDGQEDFSARERAVNPMMLSSECIKYVSHKANNG
jgi:hypothetical protein